VESRLPFKRDVIRHANQLEHELDSDLGAERFECRLERLVERYVLEDEAHNVAGSLASLACRPGEHVAHPTACPFDHLTRLNPERLQDVAGTGEIGKRLRQGDPNAHQVRVVGEVPQEDAVRIYMAARYGSEREDRLVSDPAMTKDDIPQTDWLPDGVHERPELSQGSVTHVV
jgi:hypothetical protein